MLYSDKALQMSAKTPKTRTEGPAWTPDVAPADRSKKAASAKPPRMTPAEQRRAFIEAAREAGCSEDEAEFDAALGRIVKSKTAR